MSPAERRRGLPGRASALVPGRASALVPACGAWASPRPGKRAQLRGGRHSCGRGADLGCVLGSRPAAAHVPSPRWRRTCPFLAFPPLTGATSLPRLLCACVHPGATPVWGSVLLPHLWGARPDARFLSGTGNELGGAGASTAGSGGLGTARGALRVRPVTHPGRQRATCLVPALD